jgi:TonB-linked SusC/RagA family outer membrane protein
MRLRSRFVGVSGAVFLLVVPHLGAQQVTGRVVDQRTGQPIPAVQVFIAGSGIGALSQQNGRYLLLNVPAGTHTLTAERIGYRSSTAQVTVAAGQTAVQDFTLTEEALGLDEIIVTGTPGGTQRRAIGNSVAAVAASEITETVAVSTVQDLMGSRTPGLQFARVSGNVGAGAGIEIRGQASFLLGADPLIYVDGVRINNNSSSGPKLGDKKEVNPLQDINPQDIESIEVIKGPAAATLYGTEASAGVIQIITKRGAEGSAQFNLSVREGVNFLTRPSYRVGTYWACRDSFAGPCKPGEHLVMYDAYQEANWLIRQSRLAGVEAPVIVPGQPTLFPWPTENLFQYGPSRSYNLDVRGGTQQVRYFMSAGLDDEEGLVWYNWNKAYRLRANISTVFSDNFSVDISTGFVDGETRFASPAVGDGGEWEDMVWSTGYCGGHINPGNKCSGRLDYFQEHLPSDVAKLDVRRGYSKFTGSGTLNFTTGSWLSARAILGVDKSWDKNTNLWPLEVTLAPVYEETATGLITIDKPTTTNISSDVSATARYAVTEALGTATSVGGQYYYESLENYETHGYGFPSPLSKTVNQTPPAAAIINYDYVENKSAGFYVQEELSWNDRIFLTAALRFDDNSAFGSAFSFEKYPKISGTWVLSEESFWNLDVVNSLRVRGAWGTAGRQPSTFAGTNQYQVVPGTGGNAVLRPQTPGNPEVGPELSTELELGFDLALLDDRIAGEFSWFTKKTEDALLEIPLSPSVGFGGALGGLGSSGGGAAQRNLGRIDNWGWEAVLRTNVYDSQELRFDLDFTASHIDNEVKELGTFGGQSSSFNNTGPIRIGFPFPVYTDNRIVVDAKFDPNGKRANAWGDPISATCDLGVPLGEGTQYGAVPGGQLVDCERAVGDKDILIGRTFYTYRFSVSPRLSLMNNTVTISALVDGAYGKWADGGKCCYGASYPDRTRYNPLSEAEIIYGAHSFAPNTYSTLYKADFWKLREVGLRYELPQPLVGRVGASRGALSLSAREVGTIWLAQKSTRTGYGEYTARVMGQTIADPELGGGGAFHRSGFRTLPPTTNLSATLRVTF